jgi:hypothetical protein
MAKNTTSTIIFFIISPIHSQSFPYFSPSSYPHNSCSNSNELILCLSSVRCCPVISVIYLFLLICISSSWMLMWIAILSFLNRSFFLGKFWNSDLWSPLLLWSSASANFSNVFSTLKLSQSWLLSFFFASPA